MPPKKMEAKVAALKNEVANLRNALVTMQSKADENQEKLIAMLA